MWNRVSFLAALCCALAVVMVSPRIVSAQPVTVEQIDDTVNVYFTVNSWRPGDVCKVNLLVSSDGGLTYQITPRLVKGMDRAIKVGTPQKLSWVPLEENVELEGDKYMFDIHCELLRLSDMVDFLEIPGGTFLMGDDSTGTPVDEQPAHPVGVGAFEISQYEVTNRQYLKFLTEYKSDVVKDGEFAGEPMIVETDNGLRMLHDKWTADGGFEDYPVRNVTWYGANEFCRHYGYRLPTEAEWEFVARVGGKKVQFGTGKDIADPNDMNYYPAGDSVFASGELARWGPRLSRVGMYPPNGLGVYDMSGNVWEWCQDWYSDRYYAKLKDSYKANPAGPWFGIRKVIRGGGFGNRESALRAAERSCMPPWKTNIDIGFRAVRK
jgi:formylglycine-generating enzyme